MTQVLWNEMFIDGVSAFVSELGVEKEAKSSLESSWELIFQANSAKSSPLRALEDRNSLSL